MSRIKAAFWGDARLIGTVWSEGRHEAVAERTELFPRILSRDHLTDFPDVEVVFSTWGMPSVTEEALTAFPHLKAVFYAAGSVQYFARPLLEREVAVFSAWQSNAVPVSEFTLAQILLACKGYFRNIHEAATPEGRTRRPFVGRGAYGETVALLGAGAIGRRVIDLLRPFALRVIVFDPFLSEEQAQALGVEKVSLEEAFARGYVVSNHLANKPETVNMIGAKQLAQLRENATFINTGRGATVDEDALTAELSRRPDLTALLDVTYPEPPASDSLLYKLPNIHLSSHIAGAEGDEVRRMADAMLLAFERWQQGQDDETRVTREMLALMA